MGIDTVSLFGQESYYTFGKTNDSEVSVYLSAIGEGVVGDLFGQDFEKFVLKNVEKVSFYNSDGVTGAETDLASLAASTLTETLHGQVDISSWPSPVNINVDRHWFVDVGENRLLLIADKDSTKTYIYQKFVQTGEWTPKTALDIQANDIEVCGVRFISGEQFPTASQV